MNHHYPVLIVTLPLLFAFVVSGAAWIKKSLCFPLTAVGMGLSAWFSTCLLGQVATMGPVEYRLGGWAMPWGIGYRVDTLNGLVVAVVTVLAFINLIATRKTVAEETPEKTGAFYSLYLLFIVGLTGILVTGDLFNLYVLLEVASLTSYSLIGMGNGRAPMSALNYLFVGTLGGCFYLLGVGYLYIMTGSLNMADVASLLPPLFNSSAIVMAFIFCMAGGEYQDGFFPAAYVASQCLRECTDGRRKPDCAPHDQGHGLCAHSAHAHHLLRGFCLCDTQNGRSHGMDVEPGHRGGSRVCPGSEKSQKDVLLHCRF